MQDREVQSSVCQSIYSDIQAIAAEFNLSISNHAQRSPSLIQPMCSDVMDPQAPNLPFIPVTPPLKPRKQRKLCTYTTISGNTALEHSKRRPYVYQPPPLPEINVLSPYSTKLVPPISINYSKPISQTFSKRINIDHVIPANLLALSTDASSVGNLKSVVRPNLGNSGQQGAPYIPSPGNDNDDSDDDECYSSSIWQKPPADIPRKPAQGIKPVESASGWNIPSIHPHSPSAMPRPLVETVYRGLLSENVEENIDLPNAGGSIITTKMRYTMKSIREVVEARLSRAQAIPAQSSQKPHFWNSRMEEI
jgi:hypothetical protein